VFFKVRTFASLVPANDADTKTWVRRAVN